MSLMPTTDGYELLLEDKNEFIGFQFDVELDEGATIGGVRLNGGDESDHLVACCQLQSLEASPTTVQSLEASPTTVQSLEASPTTVQSLEASPTTLTGKVTNIEFNTQDNQKLTFDDVVITVTIPAKEQQKCATPTITYDKGELVFSCETEGVEFVSEVTVGDAKKYNGSKSCDVNGDGKVDVADIATIISRMAAQAR